MRYISYPYDWYSTVVRMYSMKILIFFYRTCTYDTNVNVILKYIFF